MQTTLFIHLCLGMLWILSGLFNSFLMIFSDIVLKILKIKNRGQWILNRSGIYVFIIILAGPLSFFFGFLTIIFMIGDIKSQE